MNAFYNGFEKYAREMKTHKELMEEDPAYRKGYDNLSYLPQVLMGVPGAIGGGFLGTGLGSGIGSMIGGIPGAIGGGILGTLGGAGLGGYLGSSLATQMQKSDYRKDHYNPVESNIPGFYGGLGGPMGYLWR